MSTTGLAGVLAEQMELLKQGFPAAPVAAALARRITEAPWPGAVEDAVADAYSRLGGDHLMLAVAVFRRG